MIFYITVVFKDTTKTRWILHVLCVFILRVCNGWFVPFAPDKTRRSGNPARRRSRAGGCKAAHPDCGSAHGSLPLKTSHLHTGEEEYTERVSGRSCVDFTFNIYEAEVTKVILQRFKSLG